MGSAVAYGGVQKSNGRIATACILRRSNSRNPGESWLQDEMTSISDSAGFCASIDDRHEAWRPISNADDSLEPSQQ